MKQRASTIFLKIVIFVMGVIALIFCIFPIPNFADLVVEFVPEVAFLKYPFLGFMYTVTLVFFYALHQVTKLLAYIEKREIFTEKAIKAVSRIKISGVIMTALLYIAAMPAIYLAAEVDDAPGLIIVGFVITSAPFVVAVFAAVLQRLLQEAVNMKSDTDLTI